MRVGALCAGYGGLELGLTLAGVAHGLAWWSEVDVHAARVMAHHHPGVPNLGDLTEIVDPPPVDVVTAGFPCQPVSSAGRREGVNDERWLIHDVVGVARRAGARWLVLENVSGLFSANDGEAFGQVVDALAEGGFDAEWSSLRASDVGACHRRERWFCLARAADTDNATVDGERARPPSGRRDSGSAADAASLDAPRTERSRSVGRGPVPTHRNSHRGLDQEVTLLPTPTVADKTGSGSAGYPKTATHSPGLTLTDATVRGLADWGSYSAAIGRWERIIGRRAPSPTNTAGRLSPLFVEWMMGLPEGHVSGVPGLSRAQQLGRLGNGVVPQQAAAAITELAARYDRNQT